MPGNIVTEASLAAMAEALFIPLSLVPTRRFWRYEDDRDHPLAATQ